MKLHTALAVAICVAILTGCAMLGPTAPPPDPVVNTCVAVKTFTPAQQKAMADAIRPLSADSPLILMGQDWARMRAEARACAK